MRLLELWHWLTTSRYTLSLEARVQKLEAENAALRDTVFGLRGLPPLPLGVPTSFAPTSPVLGQGQPALKPNVAAVTKRPAADEMRQKNAAAEKKYARERLNEILQVKRRLDEELERERDGGTPVADHAAD